MIEACVVLHNYLIEDKVLDDWSDNSDISDVDEAPSQDDELNSLVPQLQLYDHQCTQLKNYIDDMYC